MKSRKARNFGVPSYTNRNLLSAAQQSIYIGFKSSSADLRDPTTIAHKGVVGPFICPNKTFPFFSLNDLRFPYYNSAPVLLVFLLNVGGFDHADH